MRMRCAVMAVLVVLYLAPAETVFAQQPPRFEVAVQTGVLRLSDFRFNTPVSIGGRLSFDVTRWLAVEGEVDYFHTDNIATTEAMTSVGNIRFAHYRRRTDALFGVKSVRAADALAHSPNTSTRRLREPTGWLLRNASTEYSPEEPVGAPKVNSVELLPKMTPAGTHERSIGLRTFVEIQRGQRCRIDTIASTAIVFQRNGKTPPPRSP